MKEYFKFTILFIVFYFLIVTFILEREKSILSNLTTALITGVFAFLFLFIYKKFIEKK